MSDSTEDQHTFYTDSRTFMVTDLVPDYKYRGFNNRLRSRSLQVKSWLCVGLDPEQSKMPAGISISANGIQRFCEEIIAATHQYAVCFKINVAFFEAFGSSGWIALEHVRAAVPHDVPVILDAKRGDIGNTSAAYAAALFDALDGDGITVSPYLGWDGLEPFFQRGGKGVLVLCRTSNPGSANLQELVINSEPLYLRLAREAVSLCVPADIGLVVGATQQDALAKVRGVHNDVMILAPGVGAQGASATDAVRLGANASGDNVLVSVSRDILYASGGTDFVEAAAASAQSLAAETWAAKESTSVNS
jgi:orotidine-5'-phosphate decarboxylase